MAPAKIRQKHEALLKPIYTLQCNRTWHCWVYHGVAEQWLATSPYFFISQILADKRHTPAVVQIGDSYPTRQPCPGILDQRGFKSSFNSIAVTKRNRQVAKKAQAATEVCINICENAAAVISCKRQFFTTQITRASNFAWCSAQ